MTHARPSKFAHVVYRTRRFAEMLDWYKTVFGAEVHHKNPAMAFLSYDDEHHRFAMIDLNVVKPDETETEKQGLVGVDHVAYTYESMDSLLDTFRRLKENGVTPYWFPFDPICHGGNGIPIFPGSQVRRDSRLDVLAR